MNASRETQDLFSKYGRRVVWRNISTQKNRRTYSNKYVWRDTFGRFACLIFGHRAYSCGNENGQEVFACKRCFKWLPKWRKP